MRHFPSTQNALRLIAIISWVVAIIWFLNDRTYESILAILAGTASLVGSFFVEEQIQGIWMKSIKAGRHIKAVDKTGQGIHIEHAEAQKDVIVSEE